MPKVNHYKYLEKHLHAALTKAGIIIPAGHVDSLIVAHGDKAYSYEYQWKENGIPFPHGVAIYLFARFQPYQSEIGETKSGWVSPMEWVTNNYTSGYEFSKMLEPVDETDKDILSLF